MKMKKVMYIVLIVLPVVVTLLLLPSMPKQVPIHYGADYLADRWGSKYEVLVSPLICAIAGLILYAGIKYASKQEKNGHNNEQIGLLLAIFTMIIVQSQVYYFLYTAYFLIEDVSILPVNPIQLVFGLIAIMLIVIGNVMPKLRKNSVLGLRTKWSMLNEETWKKSQRFGGITFMLSGMILLLICLFIKSFMCVVYALLVLAVFLLVDVYYTYKIAKPYQKK